MIPRACAASLALFLASACASAPPPAPAPAAEATRPDASSSAPPPAVVAAAADPIRTEANRRQDAFMAEGFNLTHGWTLAASAPNPTVFDFVVPPPREEHIISFWADVGAGSAAFRLVGPDGKVVAAWAGHHGDASMTLDAPPGHYLLQLDRAAGATGRALLGIKGATLSECEAPAGGSVREVAASAGKGFQWPYLLYVPKELRARRLLVVPDNTGFATEDLELVRLAASCDVLTHGETAAALGVPLLIPLFPRPPAGEGSDENLYLHALSRAALETKTERFRRVDLQLVAMIADARAALHAAHVEVDGRVLIQGFSASGMFANRFALLHPEVVRAAVVGSPGGWPIAPQPNIEGEALRYPVGIADVAALTGKPVDLSAAKRVAWLFLLGDQDTNDSVPHRDSFSADDQLLIFRRFGPSPVSRWAASEALYKQAGLNARFALYKGVAHEMNKEMNHDVDRFLREAAASP